MMKFELNKFLLLFTVRLTSEYLSDLFAYRSIWVQNNQFFILVVLQLFLES